MSGITFPALLQSIEAAGHVGDEEGKDGGMVYKATLKVNLRCHEVAAFAALLERQGTITLAAMQPTQEEPQDDYLAP